MKGSLFKGFMAVALAMALCPCARLFAQETDKQKVKLISETILLTPEGAKRQGSWAGGIGSSGMSWYTNPDTGRRIVIKAKSAWLEGGAIQLNITMDREGETQELVYKIENFEAIVIPVFENPAKDIRVINRIMPVFGDIEYKTEPKPGELNVKDSVVTINDQVVATSGRGGYGKGGLGLYS